MQSSPCFLCTLANEGQRNTLFIVPSAGTTPMSLIPLAQSLNPTHAVCSFWHAGMEGDREPHREIGEMAAAYVQELLQAQREGPYRVAGHCFGGVVAYEIARQLEAQGMPVERLVVIESFSPVFTGDPETQGDDSELEAAMELIYENARERLSVLPPATAEHLLDVLALHLEAASRYRAEPIKADIRVIRSRSHPHRLYQGWARCGMTRHGEVIIHGDTFSILTPPHVRALADAVENALAS